MVPVHACPGRNPRHFTLVKQQNRAAELQLPAPASRPCATQPTQSPFHLLRSFTAKPYSGCCMAHEWVVCDCRKSSPRDVVKAHCCSMPVTLLRQAATAISAPHLTSQSMHETRASRTPAIDLFALGEHSQCLVDIWCHTSTITQLAPEGTELVRLQVTACTGTLGRHSQPIVHICPYPLCALSSALRSAQSMQPCEVCYRVAVETAWQHRVKPAFGPMTAGVALGAAPTGAACHCSLLRCNCDGAASSAIPAAIAAAWCGGWRHGSTHCAGRL